MSDDTTGMTPPGDRTTMPIAQRSGPSDTIGNYRLLEKLGEGGMGEVYLAEQSGAIHRRVALKIIKQGMDTREVVARFEAERQALAMMDHPGIARVFDAGATDQGRPFFVMEYVNGLPITEYCDRHRLGTRERLRLFARVCDGVQHAHQKAIIHRDLKPQNVLVTLVDDQPVPKIIDFGIAKATGQSLTDKTMYTALGQLIGTPEYMSPEQMDMTGENVDTRTDIYSLGVILYELLAGMPPFDPAEFRKDGFEAVRRRIREQEPARPSTRVGTLDERSTLSARNRQTVPAKLASELRGDLDWITLKALEKDRTRRYATANAFALDILRHLNSEPVLASPPSAAYALSRLVRRHRAAFAALAAILVILTGTAVVSTSLFLRAREEAARSAQVATLMREMLAGVGPSVALGRDTKLLREILDQTTKRMDRELKGQPRVEAEMRSVLASTYADLGEYPTAETQLQRALALLTAQLGERSPEALQVSSDLGALNYHLGRMDVSESLLVRTGAAQDRILGRDKAPSLATAAALAAVYAYRGELGKADTIGSRAVAGLRRLRGESDPQTQSAMYTLAGVYTDQRRFAEAESLDVKLVETQLRQFGPENPNTLEARVALGWLYRLEGRLPDAARETREALAVMRKVLGSDHSQTQVAVNNLGIIYCDLKQYDEAEPLYLEGVACGRRVQGPKHPETIASIVNLATFYDVRGRVREAEANANESLRLFEGVVPDDFPGRGIALMIRGKSRAKLGRDAEAEADLLAADRILLPQFGPDHRRVKEIHAALHDLYARRGEPEKAAHWAS
jgi:serine/threonine protein kinase